MLSWLATFLLVHALLCTPMPCTLSRPFFWYSSLKSTLAFTSFKSLPLNFYTFPVFLHFLSSKLAVRHSAQLSAKVRARECRWNRETLTPSGREQGYYWRSESTLVSKSSVSILLTVKDKLCVSIWIYLLKLIKYTSEAIHWNPASLWTSSFKVWGLGLMTWFSFQFWPPNLCLSSYSPCC